MNIVVIEFSATWCSPCKMQHPIIEELEKNYKDKVVFKKIDVDSRKKVDKELINRHHITAVPTIVIEKDEKIVKRYVGVTSLKILEKDIETLLGKE